MKSCNTERDSRSLELDNQICFPLYSAANAMVRAYRPLLKEIDLTYSQYLVMMVLWEKNGINVKALGEKLHLDSGTLTPLLKRLEGKGLVRRTRGVEDERVRVLTLTEQGQALKNQALSVPRGMICKLNMDTEELIELKRLCEKLLGNAILES